jgi:hypothetical protein
MCQAETSGSVRSVVVGADHVTPSAERRSSTVVELLVQPTVPLFTDHINQSPRDRRTTVGETMVWLTPCTTSVGALHAVGSVECYQRQKLHR